MINYIAQIQNCAQGDNSANCLTNLPVVDASNTTLQSVLGVIFGVIAAVAVIIIVIQGIRFVLSGGDPQKAADARKGIIYAVVGLGVAISAELIVRFVIGSV